jgi:hypothetical protein
MRIDIDDTTLDEDGTHYLYRGELMPLHAERT